jgi:hypothetical protein
MNVPQFGPASLINGLPSYSTSPHVLSEVNVSVCCLKPPSRNYGLKEQLRSRLHTSLRHSIFFVLPTIEPPISTITIVHTPFLVSYAHFGRISSLWSETYTTAPHWSARKPRSRISTKIDVRAVRPIANELNHGGIEKIARTGSGAVRQAHLHWTRINQNDRAMATLGIFPRIQKRQAVRYSSRNIRRDTYKYKR